MKKLGVISSFALSAFLAVAAIPAGAQTSAGNSTVSVPTTASDAGSTPAPASVTTNLNLGPSLAPQPAAAAPAPSSDEFHRIDFFAGYSFLNNNIAFVDDGEAVQLIHGYAASVTFNLNRNFGILADFSGHNGSLNQFGAHQTEDQYYFLFGPSVSHSFGKAKISGHVLVGVANQHYGEAFANPANDFSAKEHNFAAGVGGSFDWKFTDHFAWRVLQMDYLTSIFDGERVNNLRGSTGIVVSFR
jgi:hypothetical protein